MRRLVPFFVMLALVSCSDVPTPTGADPGAPSLARDEDGDDSRAKLAAVFNTQLRAENEVPASTSEAKGHAQIKIYTDGTIAWKIKILNKQNETFVAGHIHEELPEKETGPVVVTLFSETTSDKHIKIRGSTTNPEIAARILANPAEYYVNFHTLANAPGAIRGQLQ